MTLISLSCLPLLLLGCLASTAVKDNNGTLMFHQDRYSEDNSWYEVPQGWANNCTTLPSQFQSDDLSVNAHGQCLTVCTRDDCEWECEKIEPRSYDDPNNPVRPWWTFEEKIVSFTGCPFVPAPIFYPENYFRGDRFKGPKEWANNCTNMPASFDKKAESVDTQGQCVTVCTKTYCEGRCVNITAGSLEYFDNILDGDKISSFKKC